MLPRPDALSDDDYFMALAKLSAMRSEDPSRQVGAAIANRNGTVRGTGHNRFPRGCEHAGFSWAREAPDGDPDKTKYPYVIHAEVDAIASCVGGSLEGSTMYVTTHPCNECAKLIVQAGIRSLVIGCNGNEAGSNEDRYAFRAAEKILHHAGVSVSCQDKQIDLLVNIR